MTWVLAAQAADAAVDIARLLFGARLPVAKRVEPNPITQEGFAALLHSLSLAMLHGIAPTEEAAMLRAIQGLDVNWATLTEAQRDRAIARAMGAIAGVPRIVGPKVGEVLKAKGKTIVESTKAATRDKYGLAINPSFDAVDAAVVSHAATSQAFYIRNEYGKRVDVYSELARQIVADGLEKGLDRYQIGKTLKGVLAGTSADRSEAYFRMIASVFAARSRAYATATSFEEAGITTSTLSAVVDEATCDACRFMDGKTVTTRSILSGFERVAASENPEDVREIQPFTALGRDDDGAYLYVKKGGQRVQLARIDESGVGKLDAKGSYSGALDQKGLEQTGATTPLHPACRCLWTPGEESHSTVQVPGQVRPSLPPMAPQVPLAPSAPTQLPMVFSNLPADLAQQVRPAGTRTVDAETLPEMTETEQAIADAIEKLKALPVTEYVSGHPAVAHGLSATPEGTLSPYFGPEAAAKFKTVAKLKAKPVALADIVLPIDDVLADEVEHAIHVKDPALVLVKSGGKFYSNNHGSNFIVAAHLKGDTTVQAKVIDLDKKPPVKKPKPVAVPPPAPVAPPVPVAPPPPTPAPALTADVILGTKTGGAKGSNDGGFYTGKDGVERYVKFYDDPAQAHCEHLANALYNDLDYGAPESVLFEHNGKTAYASVLFKGGKTLADAGLTGDRAKKVLDGFVGDVLTANWDAVGTGLDNAMVLPDGRVIRIDNGGTFLMRAKEGRKPESLLNSISEWDVFFSSKNPYYQKVALAAGVSGPEDMRDGVVAGIRKAIALRDEAGGWAAYVKAKVPGAPAKDAQRIVDMLDARSALLEQKLRELTAPPKPAPKPGEARYVARQYSTVLPRHDLRLEHLPESDVIADHYKKTDRHSPSARMPSGEKRSEYTARAQKAVAGISQDSLRGIRAFTGSDDGDIRESEEGGKPNNHSNAIQKAYGVATPEPGTVFRGIQSLPRAVIDAYMRSESFSLGRNNADATSSTSWCIDVSVDSFMGGRNDATGGRHKILFVLNQKTGIPVETISAVGSGECEVLMKRDARFRVTGLSRAAGTERILVIEAEEIVDGVTEAPAGAKTKARKKP